ncbi:MAG TPA: NAD(P)-dependent oxidoreductase [Candidatus Aquicultor sp.]|jgi:nucleoside-diphosphate-sugar epimerase
MIQFSSALITGANGFIGSSLARRLAIDGVTVHALIRSSADCSRLNGVDNISPIKVQSFETAELERSLAGISAEVVFNLASYGVSPQDRDPEAMIEGNIDLVARLICATSQWPLKRFIHTGSCSEYGGNPSPHEYISEDRLLEPTSLYGAAKAASVLYGTALAQQLAVPFITLRLFGVYGRGEGPHRLIPYLINKLNNNETVDLTPGEQVRDLLYIDDIVDAFIAAAESSSISINTIYNICSSQPVRIREVAESVADAMNKPRNLLQFGIRSYRVDEPLWIVGDNRRFKSVAGWRPQIILADGINRMI